MDVTSRLRAVIKEEGLSQKAFSEVIDIPLISVECYLRRKRKLSGDLLLKVTNHERFSKYTLWIMTGESMPEAGQISPSIEVQKECGLMDSVDKKRA